MAHVCDVCPGTSNSEPFGNSHYEPIASESKRCKLGHTQYEPEKLYNCLKGYPPCNRTFTTKKALLRHLRESSKHCNEASTTKFHCSLCPKLFSRAYDRKRHETEQHDNGKRICKGCGKLTRPNAHNENDASAKCNGYVDSKSTPTLQQAVENSHLEYTLDRNFIAKISGNFHQTTHAIPEIEKVGLRQYCVCDNKCFLKFAQQKRDLDPFVVPEEVYSKVASLQKSNARNTTRSIECSICHLTFESGHHVTLFKHLSDHFRTFAGGHSCEQCQVSFVHKKDLQIHQESAAAGSCGFKFKHIEPCTGHHAPPSRPHQPDSEDTEVLRAACLKKDDDRFNFCYRIWNWEQAQLQAFAVTVKSVRLHDGDLLMNSSPMSYPQACSLIPNLSVWKTSVSIRATQSEPADRSTTPELVNIGESLTYRTYRSLGPSKESGAPTRVTGLHEDALNRAVCAGEIDLVASLLEDGTEINYEDANGLRSLHYAVLFGFDIICQTLLNKGAPPNTETAQGDTPLALAVSRYDTDIAEMLLNFGADVDSTNAYGQTCLQICSSFVKSSCCRLLLRYGADINATSACGPGLFYPPAMCYSTPKPSFYGRGYTALYIASRSGRYEIVEQLLQKGADLSILNKYKESALYCALKYGHLRIVKLLLQHGALLGVELPEYSDYPLTYAIRNGSDLELISDLVQAGAEVDDCTSDNDNEGQMAGDKPLQTAAAHGCLDIVTFLLKKGAIPDPKALCAAIANQHVEVSETLLTNGANPNVPACEGNSCRPVTPLALAISSKDIDMLDLLLGHGADPNQLSNNDRVGEGVSPLILAIANGVEDAVERLVCCGANVNQYVRLDTRRLSQSIPEHDDVRLENVIPLKFALQKGESSIHRYLTSVGAASSWREIP